MAKLCQRDVMQNRLTDSKALARWLQANAGEVAYELLTMQANEQLPAGWLHENVVNCRSNSSDPEFW